MKKKILMRVNDWVFRMVAPWYIKRCKELVSLLPHENRCSISKGPYKCNCAKKELANMLWGKE